MLGWFKREVSIFRGNGDKFMGFIGELRENNRGRVLCEWGIVDKWELMNAMVRKGC